MMHLIPDAVFDQHIIALGKTGAGKSSAVRVLVEHLLDHKQRVIVVTAKADWWGLKLAADGKHAGYPIPVFGGEHADMPLHHTSGKTIAELLGTGDRSAILQMRDFMPGERTTFWIDFSSNLFRVLRGKLFLVIDEVHNFAPKGKQLDTKATLMLHWSNKLASEARGLGITLIAASQRPAKVHNDFLTSCETLIAMRVTTSWDREAIESWISGCGDEKVGDEVVRTLAQMKRGDAWVWSPEAEFGPKRIHFPLFTTYDSFRPQTPGDVKGLKGWADVDLDEVKQKLEIVVKEAEANDPAKLRAKIAELQKQIRTAPPASSPVSDAFISKAIERAVRDANQQAASRIAERDRVIKSLHETLAKISTEAGRAVNKLPELKQFTPAMTPAPVIYREIPQRPSVRAADIKADVKGNGNGELTPYQQSMIDALGDLELIGKTEPSWPLVGAAAGKSSGSSTFERYAAQLRSAGLIDYPASNRMRLTDDGRARANQREQPITSEELQKRALALLTPYQADILRALIEAHPVALPIEEIAARSSKAHGSSTFERYMASLASMEMIERPRPKTAKAADWLFL